LLINNAIIQTCGSKPLLEEKMKSTIIAVFALLLLFGATGIVDAYRGDYSAKGPNCNPERHEKITAAMDALDYSAWYELMTENGRHPRVVDVVTEANFPTFVQAHKAGVSRDLETAQALRLELGLNNGQGRKDGSVGRGQKGLNAPNRMQSGMLTLSN
jgi:hypothetical protein